MISNYVRTSLRKLRRTRIHSAINITGLTLGLLCALVAMQQMQYMNSLPLGYETEAIVEYPIPSDDFDAVERMKSEQLRSSGIVATTYSNTGATSSSTWNTNYYYDRDGDRRESVTQVKAVDEDYLITYQMELVAGRDFSQSDSVSSVIINETLAEQMGFDPPAQALGAFIDFWGFDDLPVTGVVRDFNTLSFREPIESTILIPYERFPQVGATRIATGDMDEALATIRTSWETSYPDFIFEYEFLDDTIGKLYQEEKAAENMIQAFTLIAVLIGIIGLFGLISFTTSQRAREVGIRMVLGASVASILGLLSREFVVFVVIGFTASAPVAYYAMNNWLENFAYRIEPGIGVFALAFAISLAIALLTVGSRSYRAAVVNPVDAIAQE